MHTLRYWERCLPVGPSAAQSLTDVVSGAMRRNCGNAMPMLQEMMDGTLQEKKDAKDEGLFEDEDWMLQVGWVRL